MITANQIVAAGQCLLPLDPPPSNVEIDDVVGKIARAFRVPFTTEQDARGLWRKRIGVERSVRRARAAVI